MLGSKVGETAFKLRDPEPDTSHEWRLWGKNIFVSLRQAWKTVSFRPVIMRTCLKKKGKRQRTKGHCKATEAVRGRAEEAEWHLKGKNLKSLEFVLQIISREERKEGSKLR